MATDKHRWADGVDVYEAVAFQVRTAAGEEIGEGVVGREILRLAGELASAREDAAAWRQVAERADGELISTRVKLDALAAKSAEQERTAARLLAEKVEQAGKDGATIGRLTGELADALARLERANEQLAADRRAIVGLEARVGARDRTIEAAEKRLRETEHQLAMAKETIAGLQERCRRLDERNAVACENRAKDRETEQARLDALREGRLGRKLVGILQDYVGETGDSEGAEEVLRRIIRERDGARVDLGLRFHAYTGVCGDARRLETAVEDAIGHVEAGRTAALTLHGMLCGSIGPKHINAITKPLDLAHEVLTGATKGRQAVPGIKVAATEPGPPLGGCVPESLAHAHFQLRCLAGELRAAEDRIARLDDCRGNHAVMLTGHADRLKALEERLAALFPLEALRSALEAGKE